MSRHEYIIGREVSLQGFPFYALIQAAMRQADTENLGRLHSAFPEVWTELSARYDAPAGVLPSDVPALMEVVKASYSSITCPECKMTSHSVDDAAEGYCANCKGFTSSPIAHELLVAVRMRNRI